MIQADRTVTLASGGSVTLSIEVNIFELSDSDREFVFGLIDGLVEYPGAGAE